ncbi:hypothetical protein L1049_022126 [Liquidambar formosana]|uniref:AP2/ERF domain-containing protein n=1 Tax=Liquidambar formosana TaxID=63359 RepID=A0AAP0RC03_LIQFO
MVKQSIGKPSEKNDPKFKGVRKRKWGKWVSEIRLPNSRERIWLGSYDTPEKAARAFDAALFCLRGRTAKFNFPENPPEIAGGKTLSPSEIQLAAARFANSDPPPTSHSDHSSEELQMESPSPSQSVSDVTVQFDSELMWDGPFLDFLTTMGSSNNINSSSSVSDYGIFPGFDDLADDFFSSPPPPPPPTVDYGEENFDGVFPEESFLWNF